MEKGRKKGKRKLARIEKEGEEIFKFCLAILTPQCQCLVGMVGDYRIHQRIDKQAGEEFGAVNGPNGYFFAPAFLLLQTVAGSRQRSFYREQAPRPAPYRKAQVLPQWPI